MSERTLRVLLVITSLLGYMEWGENQSAFVFETEYQIFKSIVTEITSVAHPLIILPLIGQLILLYSVFQNAPSKKWTYFSLIAIGILYIVLLLVGVLALNYKIILSTLPFYILVFLMVRQLKNKA